MNKNYLKGLKANLKELLIGIVMFIVGLVLFIVSGSLSEDLDALKTFLIIVGFIVFILGIACIFVYFSDSKDYQKTHCDECGKLITGCAYTIRHTSCEEKREQNGQKHVTVHYVVSCTCPYCGSEDTWEGKSMGSSLENAMVKAEKYVNKLYRKTTNTYLEFLDAIKTIESGKEFEFNDEFLKENYLQLKPKQYEKYCKKFDKKYDKFATKLADKKYKKL